MSRKGTIAPRDFLATSIVVVGSLGFLLWGMGISTHSEFLSWAGASIVAFVGFLVPFLSRWFS